MGSIQFHQVSLAFGGTAHPAVDAVTADIATGELVVILGPSGCGKTTLLKMVNRLYEPTSGHICVDGQDIQRLPATQLRRQMGYVIQQGGLFPHLTVAGNVAVVPRLLQWPRSRIQARVDELLHLVNLPPQDYRDRYPAQLSGGQQQRVGLARALAGDPAYLLMDEPFGALDAITRQTLQDEILRLQRQLHKTILFVSHDVEEALKLGDRILVMKAGKIVQFAAPGELLARPADAFVRQLVGADDWLRQLSLWPVTQAMTPLLPDGDRPPTPTVTATATLREALSTLLKTGAAEVTVLDSLVPTRPIGRLTLDQLRQYAARESP